MAKKRKRQPPTCSVPGCGRRHYSGGLCQTHNRQQRTTGTTHSIRPYQPRRPDTVKYAGLRLSSGCAARLDAYATSNGVSKAAAIAEVLEAWHLNKKKSRT